VIISFLVSALPRVDYCRQVIQPAPEEFEDGFADQQFVVLMSGCGSSKDTARSARVTINRSSSGGLFSEGLEMVSKGSRFNGKQGNYVAHAVDVENGYIKLNAGLANNAIIRICSGEADWLPSLQVIKLGCCDVGYHGVPFLAKAIRTLPLTTLHLRENVCIGSNFGCLAGKPPRLRMFLLALAALHVTSRHHPPLLNRHPRAAALQFCTALTDLNLTSVSLGSHGAGVRRDCLI
jgi:hypothetical protein